MPEHSYVDLLGKEYHIRRQQPFKTTSPLYRIATTEWAIQFFGDGLLLDHGKTSPSIMMIYDCYFAGCQDVFYNDLIMFRVAF